MARQNVTSFSQPSLFTNILIMSLLFSHGLTLIACFMLLFYRLVFEDNEHGLFTVTLFKKVVDEFKPKARDKK